MFRFVLENFVSLIFYKDVMAVIPPTDPEVTEDDPDFVANLHSTDGEDFQFSMLLRGLDRFLTSRRNTWMENNLKKEDCQIDVVVNGAYKPLTTMKLAIVIDVPIHDYPRHMAHILVLHPYM